MAELTAVPLSVLQQAVDFITYHVARKDAALVLDLLQRAATEGAGLIKAKDELIAKLQAEVARGSSTAGG